MIPSVPGVILTGDVLGKVIAEAQARAAVVPVPEPLPVAHEPIPPPAGRPARVGVQDPDPQELERVRRLAEEMYPGQGFADRVWSYRKAFPMSWIEQALLVCAAYKDPPRTFNPVFNLLDSWRKVGGPPEPRAVEPLAPIRVNGGATRADREEFLRRHREAEKS